jgi:signal transduction histidine kinase
VKIDFQVKEMFLICLVGGNMGNWLNLTKLIILVYTVFIYIDERASVNGDIKQVLLLMLLYIILNVGKEFFKGDKIKKLFLILSVVSLILGYIFCSSLFLFFIPLNMFEIVEEKIKPLFTVGIMFLSVLIVNKHIYTEYGVIMLFSFLIYKLVLKNDRKILKLAKNYEKVKDANYSLMLKAENDIQYREQIKYTSQIEERNKIAQEIHDKLGHSISGSIMQLEAAKLLMDKDKEKSEAIIENTIQVLRNGMEDIRSTLKNIKPPAEQLGINKVKLLIEEFKKNNNINTTIFYTGNMECISFEQWKVIYENIGEALTNTIKYAKAKNVKVKIDVLNKLIKTEIKDDGKGCESIVKSIGLSGIEERTANINGKVIVDGSDGFSVIILLPLKNESKKG